MLKKYIKNDKLRETTEYAITILAAFLIYLVMQTFIIKVGQVSGNSMEPTFDHGERVVISKFAYWFNGPDYNDIIAFPYHEDKKQTFVKRIIGLPGDEIDLVDDSFVVNDKKLDDAFSKEKITVLGNVEFPIRVPEDSYFVLGDNRNGSKDSRNIDVGCISKKDIVGEIIFRIWPIQRFGLIQ